MPSLKPLKPSPRAHTLLLRDRPYRTTFLITLGLFLFLSFHVMHTRPAAMSSQPNPRLIHPHIPPTIASRARMLQITADNKDFTYLPRPDILLITMAKGGTTSAFNWLYYGIAGLKYNRTGCQVCVQDLKSPCWAGHALHPFQMEEPEQWRVLTGPDTLRVAIQRNPFERLVSAWKSKVTCDADRYGTDLRDRERLIPKLLRQAAIPDDPRTCLSILEFAQTLDAIRTKVDTPATPLKSLRKLDVHIRPQEFYFHEVDYDIVLDVNDLGNLTYLKPILERLPYKALDKVQRGPTVYHSSLGEDVQIPETGAKLLHTFAMESKWGQTKYIL